jgi:hypothetical protein
MFVAGADFGSHRVEDTPDLRHQKRLREAAQSGRKAFERLVYRR